MTPIEFNTKLSEEFAKRFPKGWENSSLKGISGGFLAFNFGIQPVEKLPQGYKENDPAKQQIICHDIENDNTFIWNSKGI